MASPSTDVVDPEHDYRATDELLRSIEAKLVELLGRDDGHCTVVTPEHGDGPGLLPDGFRRAIERGEQVSFQQWFYLGSEQLNVLMQSLPAGLLLELATLDGTRIWRHIIGYAPPGQHEVR